MKRKAKKKKLLNAGESAGPACASAQGSPDGPAPTSTSTLTTNWNDLSASQTLALGGGVRSAATPSEGSSPWPQPYANHLAARPSAAPDDPGDGRYASPYAPRAFIASNVQSSSQEALPTTRGAAAHSTTGGLDDLTSRLYSSSQTNNAQHLSVNPFLQRDAQRNPAFAGRNVEYRGESFPPDSHERIRFDQQGMLPAPHEFPPDGMMAGAQVGGSHMWLPYPQQSAAHRPQDSSGMGISSIASSSSHQADQPSEQVVALPSVAQQAASPSSASSSSHRAGTSDTMLSGSNSVDDWMPGDPADESASRVSAAHQLPTGAMSPLHFGENDTNSSSD
jgi:hypothetical protein